MIAEKALELTNKIDNYTSLRNSKNQIEGLTSRRTKLDATLEELKKAFAVASILVKNKLMSADQIPDQGALVESIAFLKNGFTKDVKFIIENNNWDSYITAYQQWIEAITSSCQLSWSNYTNLAVPKRNEELLNILGRVPGLSITVGRINNIYDSIYLKIEEPPATEDKFNEFNNQITELKKLWKSIGSDKISEKVIGFLKEAINENGAKLDLLDGEVMNWIKENQLKNIFRITIAG